MMEDNILELLNLIEQDRTVPKNVRTKIKEVISSLAENNGKSKEVKVDQAIQQLDDLSGDPNLPPYTRTQIWSVVSALEKR